MEKTVTKEEVERALDKLKYTKAVKEEILNELFPPEYRVGDWVIGWHNGNKYKNKAWQIGGFRDSTGSVIPKQEPNWATGIEDIHHATPEEIAEATWEEGKEYRVWNANGVKLVRVASDMVGHFYIDGNYSGGTHHYDKYEKL